jgi:hypothetical protein
MATIGKTPVNQLNALPLQDADTAAAGGIIQVIAGQLYRFFDANTLGINGIPMASFGGGVQIGLVTPYLDLRGCSKYALALRCVNNTAAHGILAAIFVLMQYRMGPGDAPAVVYVNNGGAGSRDQLDNAIGQLGSTGHQFQATAGASEAQTRLWAWDNSLADTTIGGDFTAIGSDVRFQIVTNGVAMAAQNLFTCTLWASS